MSSPNKWRHSDGQQRETETIDNIYKYTNYYDLLLEYPSIGNLLSAAEFYEFQAKYNEK